MGTLASQEETGVWVQAPGVSTVSGGIIPEENYILYMQNPAIYSAYLGGNGSNVVHTGLLNT